MEFRIVSGDASGFYTITDKLPAEKAGSLFISLIKGFPNAPSDAIVRAWINYPTRDVVSVGGREWRVALFPIFEIDVPNFTAN